MRAKGRLSLVSLGGAVLVLAAACAGPQAPLDVGVKDIPTSVHFTASQAVIAAPPVPPVAAPPPAGPLFPTALVMGSTPGSTTAPARRVVNIPEPTTSPPLGPCPAASPIATPDMPASNTIQAAPAAAIYNFRDHGTYKVTGSNASSGTYPTQSTEQVKNVASNSDGGFSFETVDTLGETVTTTSYNYLPPTAASGTSAGSVPAAGLYMTAITTREGNASPISFNPTAPGLLLMEVPTTPGDVWQSTATDPVSQTSEFVTGTQDENQLVNACGQVIDTVAVHLDGEIKVAESAGGVSPTTISLGNLGGGQQYSPQGQLTFTADYNFAPQYGGLLVQDIVHTTGTESGSQINRSLTSSIDQLPRNR